LRTDPIKFQEGVPIIHRYTSRYRGEIFGGGKGGLSDGNMSGGGRKTDNHDMLLIIFNTTI